MAVHVLQVLCPRRHCLFALAYEEEKQTAAEARRIAEEAFAAGVLNRWCGICQSRDIRFEIGKTRFANMAEATPALAECEAQQLAARQHLESKRN